MLRALLYSSGLDENYVNRCVDGDLKEEPLGVLGGRSTRYGMQTLGTEWGRQIICDDLWIGITMARVRMFLPGQDMAIVDVRFANEARAILDAGGKLVRIVRPSLDQVVTADEHASENCDVLLPFCSATIVNDCPASEYARRVREVVESLFA
jgi:hypothetical protein